MTIRLSRFIQRIVCCPVLAVSSLILMAGTVLAQQPTPGTNVPDVRLEERERQNREMQLRNAGGLGSVVTELNQQRLNASIDQLKQDFRRIQIIRNEMIDYLLADKPLDYKRVAEQTAEINKRSLRLKAFLMQPTPDAKEKEQQNQVELNNEGIKGALVKLCNLIFSFTENPILKNPGTVDVEQSAKAGRDLLGIVEISSTVKKSAEKLKQSSK
ncbi:MAG TPA: hypothetical protein VGX92_06685 [Pyrinomonadaceae bacterium]|nr:hypothetical protein [Pyrinomonadaceae bacterium]